MPLEDVDFTTNPDPRCACVLLLDTSASMAGEAIQALNHGMTVFEEDIQQDALAKRRVEIAIVTFGNGTQTVQEFISASRFKAPKLSADGDTPMGEAITTGVQLVKDRTTQYRANGILRYRPWILMITDGKPTDEWESAAKLAKSEMAADNLVFFAVGVSGADMTVLKTVTQRSMKLKGLNFRDLFLWLSASQKRVSGSTVGEQTPLPDASAFCAAV